MKKGFIQILMIAAFMIVASGCNQDNKESEAPLYDNKIETKVDIHSNYIHEKEVKEDNDTSKEDISKAGTDDVDTSDEDIPIPWDIPKEPSRGTSVKLNPDDFQGFETWPKSKAVDALKRVLAFEDTVTESNAPQQTYYTYGNKYFLDGDYYNNYPSLRMPDKYAVVDIDHDSSPEVVVQFSLEGYEYREVLRYYNGIVHGYFYTMDGLQSLRTNGSFTGDSYGKNNQLLTLSFKNEWAVQNCLGYTVDIEDNTIYHVEDRIVKKEDFDDLYKTYENYPEVTWYLYPSIVRSGYNGQLLFHVNFTAKTYADVEDLEGYYQDIEDERSGFSHSSKIPLELSDLILKTMNNDTKEKALTPLFVEKEISQEEFNKLTGLQLEEWESIWAVKVDADNDGIEDLVCQRYGGGSAGFCNMELYKGSLDGKYTLMSTFFCFLQDYNFLFYEGKNYLLMKEFDYATKYDNGYSLYLYENGALVDGKIFNIAINNCSRNTVYEDTNYEGIDAIKHTLYNKKIPEILTVGNGVIYGTAESRNNHYFDGEYEYSSDIDNDGDQDLYNKYMWYPSSMGRYMRCEYYFKESTILNDLCLRLESEVVDGVLYTFWLDEVNGKNILYLYYGENLDYSLYAYLITK